jgi:hypothetical protein
VVIRRFKPRHPDLQLRQLRFGLLTHSDLIEEPESAQEAGTAQLPAQEDVRDSVEVWRDGEILVDGLDPVRPRLLGELKETGCPSNSIVPASGAVTPVRQLMKVDLPAPLSPMSATISPWRTAKSTPCSAWTGPKCFSIPVPGGPGPMVRRRPWTPPGVARSDRFGSVT